MLIAWCIIVFFFLLGILFYLVGYKFRIHTHYRFINEHAYEWRGPFVLGIVISWVVAGIALVITCIATFVPAYEEGVCEKWGTQVERETRFIRTNFWEWGCYVNTDEGWIGTDKMVKVDD